MIEIETFVETIFRFALVFSLSLIYGLQRQKSHKPIGFGTFTLVAIGSCGLATVAVAMGPTNAVPLLGAIVTGIGFLGAGALIRSNDKIFGFTTASSIWLFAIFGMIIGLGYYFNGFLIYFLVWVVVAFDNYLEKKGIGSYRRKISITTAKMVNKEDVTNIFAEHCTRFNLISINIDKKEKAFTLNYLIEGLKQDIELLIKEFYKNKWCTAVKFD